MSGLPFVHQGLTGEHSLLASGLARGLTAGQRRRSCAARRMAYVPPTRLLQRSFVDGGPGGVAASGGCGPVHDAGFGLGECPAGGLLDAVVAAAGRRTASYAALVINAVVFDVGETLVDETREYGTWADWLGVPGIPFSSVFGAVIALGMDYREAFQYFRPGFDLVAERERRAERGSPRLSARVICTRTRARPWPRCEIWACGSAWRATRPPGPGTSCGS